MHRIPIAVPIAALLMGLAVWPPILLDSMQREATSSMAVGVASVGCLLIVTGLVGLISSCVGNRSANTLPSGARLILTANILFLAFFSLECSDLLVRQNGKVLYWTNGLFLPAIILFWGLLRTQSWAWWMSRIISGLGVLWFLGFAMLIPFGDIRRNGVPAPFEARLTMICASLGFAAVLMCAFFAIGHPATRSYFHAFRRDDPLNIE